MQTAKNSTQQSYTWWMDILLLTLFLSALFFIFLGTRPLLVPDEGRYAEIAREMVVSHDYVTPFLNGIKYFEKPVLFYWLTSFAIKFGTLSLWSLRSVNAVFGVLGCLLTYVIVRQLYDRLSALLAACLLGTSVLYFMMAHMINLDMTVTFFLTTSLYAFLLSIYATSSKARLFYLWGASAAAACAVLTKGLIGVVFPMLIMGIGMIILKKRERIQPLYLFSSCLVFLAIVLPWHVMVSLRHPEFPYFYFIEQHFLRYTNPLIGHYQPVWFFIPVLFAGFFPWVVFLPQTFLLSLQHLHKNQKNQSLDLFWLLWIAVIFIFFSFSKSKLISYILPIFPPLAILTARYLVNVLHQNQSLSFRISYHFMMVLSILLGFSLLIFPQKILLFNPTLAIHYLTIAAILFNLGILIAWFNAAHHPARAIYITFFTIVCFLLLLMAAIPAIDTRTIRPLAQILKPILKAQDEVITYNQYYQDLPFYLERRVSILNWHNELTYGMKHQDTHEWMINDKDFWKRWHSQQQIFAIMSNHDYENLKKQMSGQLFFISQTKRNSLVTNHPLF